ncbi:MAG: DUF4258 domain-containing protein [Desulfococcaceae bacterium]
MFFIEEVLSAFHKEVLFTSHALHQMNLPERMITKQEVKETVLYGEIIEDYQQDIRGHSCLFMRAVSPNRIIHVVCSPKKEYLTIVSAYLPSHEKWESDWKTRKTV